LKFTGAELDHFDETLDVLVLVFPLYILLFPATITGAAQLINLKLTTAWNMSGCRRVISPKPYRSSPDMRTRYVEIIIGEEE
jgi:hypothetical protein